MHPERERAFPLQDFQSDDFLAKVEKAATDAEIKKFYDDNLEHKSEAKNKDIFLTPATLSLEALAYKDEKAFANIAAPTDADLKTTYDNFKGVLWKDPADAAKFQPFEKVKPEVEKKWRSDKMTILKSTVEGNVTKAFNALDEAEKKFKAEEEKKFKADPAYKVKDFDVAAWARANDMIYWVTPAQTEEVYAKGKLEVNAPDLSLGTAILKYTKPEPNQPESSMENQKKHMDEFTSFTWINHEKPELGGIRAHKKVYVEEATKTLEQAKDKIVERLKVLESVKLAEEAADKQRDEWRRGDNLPKLADLEEIISEKKESHPLVQRFRKTPKADGEVLDVVSGQPEADKPDPKEDDKKWFYVGCAVERKLPSLSGFMADTEWNRDSALNGMVFSGYGRIRPGIISEDFDSMLGMMIDQIKSNVKRIGGESEPDVRTSFRNSGSQGDY